MLSIALLLVLWGCPHAVVTPTPVGARDGEQIVHPTRVTVAVVGDLDGSAQPLDDVRVAEPQLVVLTGDAVSRGTDAAWEALVTSVSGLPVIALAGDGERVGDPHLEAYARAWSGLGVAGLPRPVPWRHVDVVSAGVRWRLVFVDGDREALGDLWREQLFWLPKALADEGWDHLVVVTNHPLVSLVDGFEAREGPSELRQVIEEHTAAGAVVAWVSGGEGATELLLPEGRWNGAELVAGCSGGDARTLRRADGSLVLPDGLARALIAELWRWRANGAHDPTVLEEGGDFEVPRYPVCGWWQLRVEGARLHADLRMQRYRGGWSTVWTASWEPATGWRTDP